MAFHAKCCWKILLEPSTEEMDLKKVCKITFFSNFLPLVGPSVIRTISLPTLAMVVVTKSRTDQWDPGGLAAFANYSIWLHEISRTRCDWDLSGLSIKWIVGRGMPTFLWAVGLSAYWLPTSICDVLSLRLSLVGAPKGGALYICCEAWVLSVISFVDRVFKLVSHYDTLSWDQRELRWCLGLDLWDMGSQLSFSIVNESGHHDWLMCGIRKPNRALTSRSLLDIERDGGSCRSWTTLWLLKGVCDGQTAQLKPQMAF